MLLNNLGYNSRSVNIHHHNRQRKHKFLTVEHHDYQLFDEQRSQVHSNASANKMTQSHISSAYLRQKAKSQLLVQSQQQSEGNQY
mmetsp:Transcript_9095/g.27233  ORF Transcript_9095/g.27233 Transcript_9095/m.27233 type:complete len:85 (+) Transcript_9095:18-272(+)